MTPRRDRWMWYACAAYLVNLWFPRLRFEWPLANYVLSTAAAALFILLFVRNKRQLRPGRSRLLFFALAAVVAGSVAMWSIAGLFSLLVNRGDDWCECIAAVDAGGATMAAYRCDYLGATGDFTVEVRQELKVLPGLRLDRPVVSADHARTATLSVLDGRRVRVTIPVTDQPVLEQEIVIRPYLWF